ncbi:MAG: T9SS type A sorting domain-containing protein [Microscillaceae bacterium]|nr:T9SS type A sorting domain-containing protein [Microscillaceae bacterium]
MASQILVVINHGTSNADSTLISNASQTSFKVCANQIIQLRALVEGSGNIKYKWFDFNNNVFSTDSIFIGSLPENLYTVEVRNESSIFIPPFKFILEICSVSAPPIDVSIKANGTTSLCTLGGTQTLTLEASADNPGEDFICFTPDFTYQWYKNSVLLVGQTDRTLQINNVPESAGTYSVEVSNACGSSLPVSIVINTIDVQPNHVAITTDDGTNTICQGKTLQLRAAADNADAYRWFKSGSTIPIGTGTTLTINSPGIYELEASNGCGSKKVSRQIFLLNIPSSFSVISSPADGVLCDTQISADFGVSIVSFADYFELYKDNVLFETNVTPNFSTSQVGAYQIFAYNKCGFRASNTVQISRINAPTFVDIELEGTASPSLSPTCSPPTDSITLKAVSDGTGLVHKWFFSPDSSSVDFVQIENNTEASLVVKEIGFYFVRAINKCDSTDSAVLKIIEAGDIDAQAIAITAQDGTVSCTGSVELQTDNLGEGVSYLWKRQEDNLQRTTVINRLTISETGTYTVQGFNACGATLPSDPILLQVELSPANPELLINGTALVCVENGNEQRILSAQVEGTNLNYQWFKDGQPYSSNPTLTLSAASQSDLSGKYSFIADNVCGTVFSDTLEISFVAPPKENEINLLVDACSDPNVVKLSVQTSASNPTFTWYRNNSAFASTSTPLLEVNTNGQYRVNVSNACEPVGVFSREVNVEVGRSLSIPQIVSLPTNQVNTLCPGTSLTLKAEVEDGILDLAYRWFKGNQVILGAVGNSIEVNTSGVYRVEIFSLLDFTCSAISLPYEVFVRPEPTLLLTFRGSLSICAGDSVLLKASATSQPIQYQWFKDNQLISTQDSLFASESGIYRVEALYDENAAEFPCEYLKTQSLEVITLPTPEPEIVLEGRVLRVLEAENYSNFQWNVNGIPILEATETSHLPLDPGDYSITVRNTLGCEGTSESLSHPGTFLDSTEPVWISPNPNSGTFKIVIVGENDVQISIYNNLGQKILSETDIPSANSISGFAEIRVGNLSPGIYFVRTYIDGNFISRKLIVEK